MTKPNYVYVASSWRNPMHADVCARLAADGIDHYDFKNPPGGTGFSWKEVKTETPSVERWCLHCGQPIVFEAYPGRGGAKFWRHVDSGFRGCASPPNMALPGPKPKGSDWESADEYLRMIAHPRAIEGFDSDFAAMQRADHFVMVLPCGKSAHLELGWAVGAGKRTAILLEDPVEPELMYRMVDYLAPSFLDLLGWLGVQD